MCTYHLWALFKKTYNFKNLLASYILVMMTDTELIDKLEILFSMQV